MTSPRHVTTLPLPVIFTLGCIFGVFPEPDCQAELRAHGSISLDACRGARAVAENPDRVPGVLTRAYVSCFDDLLQSADALAQEANAERLETVTPLLNLYRQLRTETVSLLHIAPNFVSRRDLRQFEEATVVESRILNEVVAFETFLNAPPSLVSVQEKQDKTKVVIDSIKALFNKLLGKLGEAEAFLSDVILGKKAALNELLQALKGK